MNIAIGSDHAAFERKEALKVHLAGMGHTVTDYGAHTEESVDYPAVARPLCVAVARGEHDMGVLVCGTGVGMSIAANKVCGVRCALCADVTTARLTREHNDANVLAMGARTLGELCAIDILTTFVTTAFSGDERHARRITMIEP